MAVTLTSQRVGRATALLAAFQSAKGTAATDFTAASAARLWTSEVSISGDRPYSDFQGNTETSIETTSAAFKMTERPAGSIMCHATPASVELLMKNSYGTYSSPNFTLVSQVAATQWLTLGWVENTATGAVDNLVRIIDAWFHRLKFSAQSSEGIVEISGDYAGRSTAVQALNAGGITFPTVPMNPADVNLFTGRTTTLVRDPASANVGLRFDSLEIVLDHGVNHMWDSCTLTWNPIKTGLLNASLRFVVEVGDETWVALTNARAGTKQRYRVVTTAPSPSKTLTFDFYEMAFEFERFGHRGKEYAMFTGNAAARKTATGGTGFTVTLA